MAAAAVLTVISADADIVVNFPEGAEGKYDIEYQLVSDAMKPRGERGATQTAVLEVTDGKGTLSVTPDGDANYVIPVSDSDAVMIYTRPGDNLTVNITSLAPLTYAVSGSALMEGISALMPESAALEARYRGAMQSETPDREKMARILEQYNNLFIDYIKNNPTNPAAVYAVLQLDGEDYVNAFNSLTDEAKNSVLYPFAERQLKSVESQLEAKRKMEAMAGGDFEAPAFTFNDLNGHPVSLKDYRGQWVIIDFWGAWCPWCIKGFPKLKEAYLEYAPRLEVIGVDCRDTEAAWRAAVKKYELPWVNVYNPDPNGGKILEDYAVQGFPTKVVVNPEGKIANITVGEDPDFFNKLRELIKGER